jgi:hypothetical protein
MAFKAICIILVIAVLLEDGSSMKKKTEEEKKEDRELAEKVNATLIEEEEKKKAEEEKKKTKEEKTQEDDGKRTGGQKEEKTKEDDRKKTGGQRDGEEKATVEEQKGQDEACPSVNFTCPIVEPCPKPKECPAPVVCEECPEAKKCGPCPTVQPCKPCPEVNGSRVNVECPTTPSYPESGGPSMTVPVAIAVGITAGLLIAGVAAVIGLALRYASPIVSGFLFLFLVILTWYLSSHYPEVAREAGGRVVAVLREATVALGHRIMEAIRHHNDQVGLPVNSILL